MSDSKKLSFDQLSSMLTEMGADAKQTMKVAKALKVEVPKTTAERFTVVDTAEGKRLVVRNPGTKGKPRTVDPKTLGDDISNAKRILADLQDAENYLASQGLL